MSKKYILVLKNPFQEEKNYPIKIQRRSAFIYRYLLQDSAEDATRLGLIRARLHLLRFKASSELRQSQILKYRRGKGKLAIRKVGSPD